MKVTDKKSVRILEQWPIQQYIRIENANPRELVKLIVRALGQIVSSSKNSIMTMAIHTEQTVLGLLTE